MNRIPFDHVDEIMLRLSNAAKGGRINRHTSGNASSRLDGFICDLEASQRDLVALRRRKISARSPEVRSDRDVVDWAQAGRFQEDMS